MPSPRSTPEEKRLDVIRRLEAICGPAERGGVALAAPERQALRWAIRFLRTAEASQRHRDELFRLTQGQTWRDPRALGGTR